MVASRPHVAALVLLVGSWGCKGAFKADDPCGDVEVRVDQLLRRAVDGDLADAQLARRLESAPADLARRCREEAWSESTRTCFTSASVLRDIFANRCDPSPNAR